MAGHSKWANIQHRKGAQDAKRGKLFTKLIREITVAARMGGADMDGNPRLRSAVDTALGSNMSKDTINRAVKRGTGDLEGQDYQDVVYEGYGHAGVAILVECLTDNKTRTVAEVRHAFLKYGGNMGASGSVSYLFTKTGVINFSSASDEERLIEIALEAGAEDVVQEEDGSFDVITSPESYITVKEALAEVGLIAQQAGVLMQPSTTVKLTDDEAESLLKLLTVMEDLDDVQNVYSNAEFPAAV